GALRSRLRGSALRGRRGGAPGRPLPRATVRHGALARARLARPRGARAPPRGPHPALRGHRTHHLRDRRMTRSDPIVALYPGSFDPITRGHEDIARRTLRIADRVLIGVAHTSTHTKRGLFAVEERVEIIREV